MSSAAFAIVGGGWRAEFYLRVARHLPDRFRATGVMTNNVERATRIASQWNVPVRSTLDELLEDRPAFVVLSVPRTSAPELMRELDSRRVPVLAETPPAADVAGLRALGDVIRSGARIQVAEQYQFQPLHAARLAIVASGRLGTPTQAQVSVAHDYHGIDLMRRYLGVGFDDVAITARRSVSPIVAGPDRGGPPLAERIDQSEQYIAWFDFLDGARLGVYDFTMDQYFSWIRAPRLLVRGERGEIHNSRVSWLVDALTPISVELERRDTGQDGNLEGLYHAGLTLGDEWVYRNPFVPARLTDDEIAVASCMQRMLEYLEGGSAFCSLAEAAWDHELSLAMAEAATTGRTVHVTRNGFAPITQVGAYNVTV
jgi:Oxidoreductase family, NAD-binding Rossmann fold